MRQVQTGLAALAVAAMAGVAAAYPTVSFTWPSDHGTTNGGVFDAATSDRGTFGTFCLERSEHINLGRTYSYTVSTEAKYNGVDGNSDPLSSESAYIYTQFRAGNIRSILGDNGLTNSQVADAVQTAIWELEGEGVVNGSDGGTAARRATLLAAAGSAITGGWGGVSGLGNVRVMNVWTIGSENTFDGRQQDMLVIIPLPTGAGLAGVGLFGLAAVRRRRG